MLQARLQEQGQKPNQEDSIYPANESNGNGRIYLVCDGMGGHEHGEVASRIVANTVGRVTSEAKAYTTEEMKQAFAQGVNKAYDELDKVGNVTSKRSMGTTLTFLAICMDGLLVAHLGDSRVYLFRRKEGVVFQTKDHSLLNDLLDSGQLDKKNVATFPYRNVITRALQAHQLTRFDATFTTLTDVRKGDVLMLCSDGIVEQTTNEDLTNILLSDKPLQERAEDLKAICQQRNTRDNHSCIILETESDKPINELSLSNETSQAASTRPPLSISQTCKTWWKQWLHRKN